MDHFGALEKKISACASDLWVFGGDLNSHTASSQPTWGTQNPLDFCANTVKLPARSSADQRPLNLHGRRLLQTLVDKGIILNGLLCRNFDG
eukprot:5997473-Karenia_brevis.AAC.1